MEPSWDFDWVCRPDPGPQSVVHDYTSWWQPGFLSTSARRPVALRPALTDGLPLAPEFDSGAGCIDIPNVEPDVIGRLSDGTFRRRVQPNPRPRQGRPAARRARAGTARCLRTTGT